MVAAATCSKCGSTALRYSQRRRKDGLLRLLFCSAFRCHACGRRHHRINFFAVAAAAAVLLLLAFFLGVGEIIWTYYEQKQAPPLGSPEAVSSIRFMTAPRPRGFSFLQSAFSVTVSPHQ